MRIDIDTSDLKRGLSALVQRQLPFALAQTLNEVARAAQGAERAAMVRDLDRPKPFTVQQGVRVALARKTNLEASVYVPPIQSRYLAPEIEGGIQVLNAGSRAVLRPINQATDQYGNIPRNTLNRLRRRKDIFVGRVHGIDGVWQRLDARGKKRLGTRLRLLIRFSDPVAVKTRYPFGRATIEVTKSMIGPALQRNLGAALRSAR